MEGAKTWKKRIYTWHKKNHNKQARLDFFLISDRFGTDLQDSTIIPGYRTDHSIVLVKFEFGKFKKGRGLWKFNNSLLKDIEFAHIIKQTIRDTKLKYMDISAHGETNIDDIPNDSLTFTINDQLLFEMFLMEIRGKTISYATFKKRQTDRRETDLLNRISNLENEQTLNHTEIEEKRNELQEIRRIKMQGHFIRSRARWIEDGEKATNYFCNLENRHFISKQCQTYKPVMVNY